MNVRAGGMCCLSNRLPGWRFMGLALLILLSGCATDWPDAQELSDLHYASGRMEYDSARFEAAVERFLSALHFREEDRKTRYHLALAYGQLGRFSEADKLLTALAEEDGENIHLREAVAWIRYRENRPAEALELYEKLFRDYPAMASAGISSARLALELEDYSRARNLIDMLIRYGNLTGEVMLLQAEVHQRTGDPAAGEWLAVAAESSETIEGSLLQKLSAWIAELESPDKVISYARRLELNGPLDRRLGYVTAIRLLEFGDMRGMNYFSRAREAGLRFSEILEEDIRRLPPEIAEQLFKMLLE